MSLGEEPGPIHLIHLSFPFFFKHMGKALRTLLAKAEYKFLFKLENGCFLSISMYTSAHIHSVTIVCQWTISMRCDRSHLVIFVHIHHRNWLLLNDVHIWLFFCFVSERNSAFLFTIYLIHQIQVLCQEWSHSYYRH